MNTPITRSYNKIAKAYVLKHGYGERLSISALNKFISFLPQRSSVLDVGCGGGQDSKYLYDHGCIVRGIDVSREMIKLAKKQAAKVIFEVKDVMKIPTRKKFDGIWCCRVFHHISLQNQSDFLNRLAVLLKKDGILYITSVVSAAKKDYEAFDSGNDGLLKKRLMPSHFKQSILDKGFTIIHFNYWTDRKGMEIIAKKTK